MKAKTKRTTGTESEKWTSHRGSSEGRRKRERKVQGQSSIISRHKIDGERLKMV